VTSNLLLSATTCNKLRVIRLCFSAVIVVRNTMYSLVISNMLFVLFRCRTASDYCWITSDEDLFAESSSASSLEEHKLHLYLEITSAEDLFIYLNKYIYFCFRICLCTLFFLSQSPLVSGLRMLVSPWQDLPACSLACLHVTCCTVVLAML
jgi:hypothetical protein